MYALVWQNNYRSCSYELFKLIREKRRSKATTTNYTKAYHIIYLLCSYAHVESNRIRFYILWFLCNLLWFFKYLAKINKKRKRQNLYSKNLVLNHTILYVHCVDLLMWSPTELDFIFYIFSMIYYDFSKIQPKYLKNKKIKPPLL